MANSLDIETEGILKILTISLVGFTSMEESGHFLARKVGDLHLVLVIHDHLGKIRDLGSEIFLIHQIKACDELG